MIESNLKGKINVYDDIYITLSLEQSIIVLQQWIEQKENFIRRMGKNIIDNYVIDFGESKKAIVVVIEYYTWRNRNQMTATVILDNIEKNTKVHIVVGGSSQGMIFSHDYGARNCLEEKLKSLFKIYEVKEMR